MKKENKPVIIVIILITVFLLLNYQKEGAPRGELAGEQYEEWRCVDVTAYYSQGYKNLRVDENGCQIVVKSQYATYTCTWGCGCCPGNAGNIIAYSAQLCYPNSCYNPDTTLVSYSEKGGYEKIIGICEYASGETLKTDTFTTGMKIAKNSLTPGINPTTYSILKFCKAHPMIIRDVSSTTSKTDTTNYDKLDGGQTIIIPANEVWTLFYITNDVQDIPDVCLDEGINNNFQCAQWLDLNINSLQITLDAKLAIINQLNINIQEKEELIKQLEAERDRQLQLILQLELTVDEFAQLITDFEMTIEEQVSYINQLNLTVKRQAELISELDLTVKQQADLIGQFNLTIAQQAIMITELSVNLANKAYLVSLLTVENQRQADLIIEMEDSFANQGAIISALQLNISDDARIIGQMTSSINEQGQLIIAMNLTNQQQAGIISELYDNIEDQAALISSMRLTNQQQADIINQMGLNIVEQTRLIKELKLSNEASKDLINKLLISDEEKQNMIDSLTKSLEQSKFESSIFKWAAVILFAGLIISIMLPLIRKKRK